VAPCVSFHPGDDGAEGRSEVTLGENARHRVPFVEGGDFRTLGLPLAPPFAAAVDWRLEARGVAASLTEARAPLVPRRLRSLGSLRPVLDSQQL
jgi:hypothetical protein